MFIADDHLPFLRAGVPILHLIPGQSRHAATSLNICRKVLLTQETFSLAATAPFPPVWHKMTDNADALDQDTVNSWSLLTQLVVAELLHETPRLKDELVGRVRSSKCALH